MPELPEVETVVRGLIPMMRGKVIRDVIIHQNRLRWELPDDFAARLRGQTVQNITRRAKYMVFDLGGYGFLGHLGMSGSMRKLYDLRKHDHIVFDMGDLSVAYHDPRRFGAMDLWHEDAGAHKWLSSTGPEPLGNDFNGEYLFAATRARNTSIKAFILDQKHIAGIGNIYASESLWRARINPMTRAGGVTQSQADLLTSSIRDVLSEAIASGGSSLRDHRQTNGEMGYFQHRFDTYDRDGEPCRAEECEGTIVKVAQSGRSSFYCPYCQIDV